MTPMMSDTSFSVKLQEEMEEHFELCHETKVFLKYCPNEWWKIWSSTLRPFEATVRTVDKIDSLQISLIESMQEWVQASLNTHALNSFTLELLGDWKIRYDRLAMAFINYGNERLRKELL